MAGGVLVAGARSETTIVEVGGGGDATNVTPADRAELLEAAPLAAEEPRQSLGERVRQAIEALVYGTVRQLRVSMEPKKPKDVSAGGDREAVSPLDRAVAKSIEKPMREHFPKLAKLDAASVERLLIEVAGDMKTRVSAALEQHSGGAALNAVPPLPQEKALEMLKLLLLPSSREELRITDPLVAAVQYQCRSQAINEAEAGKKHNAQVQAGPRWRVAMRQILPEDDDGRIPAVLRDDITPAGVTALVREKLAACSCETEELTAWESTFLPKRVVPRAVPMEVVEEEPEDRTTGGNVTVAGRMVAQGS